MSKAYGSANKDGSLRVLHNIPRGFLALAKVLSSKTGRDYKACRLCGDDRTLNGSRVACWEDEQTGSVWWLIDRPGQASTQGKRCPHSEPALEQNPNSAEASRSYFLS